MTNQDKCTSNDAPLTKLETQTRHAKALTSLSTETISASPLPKETQRMLQTNQIEQKAQNKQLCQSQSARDTALTTYLNLYDFAPVGYCTISESGIILRANITAARMLGVSCDELRSRLLSDFIIEEDQDRYSLHHKQILVSEEPCSYELRMVKWNGTQFLVHLVACAAHDANGVRVFQIMLSNITDSKIMAVALHESEQFKLAILNAISSQIAVLNRDGIIVAVNEAWQRFALENSNIPGQAARHTQIGTNYLDICRSSMGGDSAEGAQAATKGILAVLEGYLPRFNLDYPCHSPNQQRWFTLSVTPMLKQGVVITHVDITARKMAEENLARQRDTLVREVHHRIKNNLQGVAGLLQRELGKFHELNTPLATAISQVNAIAIVHGLQASYPDETICLCDSVRHICTMVSELARHPVQFQIEHERSFSPVQITANETVSIALILNELILNAVKHAPEGSGPPIVSLQVNSTGARIHISNLVSGVPDFNINTGKGIGTGLSLVRSLLPKNGAHLTYVLDQPGSILATLRLTPPVVVTEIHKEKD